MSKRERVEASAYKARAQLYAALPDDMNELKRLAAKLLAKNAVLERELELAIIHGRHSGKTAEQDESRDS